MSNITVSSDIDLLLRKSTKEDAATFLGVQTYSTAIDGFLSASNESGARTAIGLGGTDTVEFGAFIPPAGTAAEIDAVSNATIGQVMLDTDRDQIVRFTGASSREVVASKVRYFEDENTASAALTLNDSKLLESGIVADGAGEVFIKTASDSFKDSFPASYGNFSNIWYDLSTFSVETGTVIKPDVTTQIKGNGNTVVFDFHRSFISQETAQDMFSVNLFANVSYTVELELDFMDFQTGNARFDLGFTGVYSSASGSMKLEDKRLKSTLANVNFSNLDETDNMSFSGSSTPTTTSSAHFNKLYLTLRLTPSTAGTWTFKPRQIASSVKPLYTSKGLLKVSS
tara:strand:+ start:1028 stop:2050 length:1023 start_codon:yes stop_codon:yes gene_type:complete